MNDVSLTILPEIANDAQAIERLHARTFGPGRFVLSAYRIREHVDQWCIFRGVWEGQPSTAAEPAGETRSGRA